MEGQPYVVLEAQHVKMGRGGAVLQIKIQNLITKTTLERSFKQADRFSEAEVEKKDVMFLYAHRGEFWFSDKDDKSKRFMFTEEKVAEEKDFLKPNTLVEAQVYEGQIIRIVLPIKIDLKVTEAPPSLRGNTAESGTKTVTLETGAKVQTPLFIEAGDTIRVNTETKTYVERVEKGK